MKEDRYRRWAVFYRWKPELFQGRNRSRSYFEGWYFKMIDGGEQRGFAVIPGIALGTEEENSHAFIQVFGGGLFRYYTFPLSAFTYHPSRFEISIGNNRFGSEGIDLACREDGHSVSGSLRFSRFTPWPVSPLSVGAMGWYGLIPTMEDYHGVLSFDHRVEGELSIDGERYDLSGGKGYTEKDWGTSFPESWIWVQSNHFTTDGASLHAAVAKIPWRNRHFPGFIVGFFLRGKLYRFCTYNRGKIVSYRRPDGDSIHLVFKKGPYRLKLDIMKEGGTELKAPKTGNMTGRVNESLTSRIQVELTEKEDLLFRETGRWAGVEIHGDVEGLIGGLSPGDHPSRKSS